jgi:hypothetical protein
MASLHNHDHDDEPGRDYDEELLTNISTDEAMADAPQNKDEECRSKE